MSKQYPGGIISKTAPTPSGPYANDTAPGVWTLEQQAYWQKLGQWPTAGNVNPSAFIENLFSTYLYTGNGSTQTITNGIDLAGEGGMVWLKCRNSAENNEVYDTVRGANQRLITNTTGAQVDRASSMAFSSTGLSWVGDNISNTNGNTYASWTFRKQPKFFDVVTLNSSTTTYNHSLGSTPGCIIVKCTDASGANWVVWHRSFANTTNNYLSLNTTDAVDNFTNAWPSAPTSTQFSVNPSLWANGSTGIAYLFAHDAGGFGLTGTDNVISCGAFTTNGSGNATISLGYEPQWLMIKETSGAGQWWMQDTMRGFTNPAANGTLLRANTSDAEIAGAGVGSPTSTGFTISGQTGSATHIYIAIRRGPMKVPTSGTSVFAPEAWTGDGSASRSFSGGFVDDAFLFRNRAVVTEDFWFDRLRGNSNFLQTANTNAEVPYPFPFVLFDSQQNGVVSGTNPGFGGINTTSATSVGYHFKRAPSFFDEVCYTGTGSATTVTHNLGAVPELIIVKIRDAGAGWYVYNKDLTSAGYYLLINSTAAQAFSNGLWNSTQPTSSSFTVGTGSGTNGNGSTYVAYLFATCAGVSKVGSYTGTATTLQVDCGFTGGARFVLIKRTDSTGDWYVWDSARGIVAGNDPYLLLNSTDAEVTGTDYVDTYSAGFEISSTAPAAINASGGTFIFLAIA